MNVLIIDNDPNSAANLERWVQEVGVEKQKMVYVDSPAGQTVSDFENWFDQCYSGLPKTAKSYVLVLLDIIFNKVGGTKQDFGGVELWNKIQVKGYSGYLAQLVVVSNQYNLMPRFQQIGTTPIILVKQRERVLEVLRQLM